MNIKKYLQDIDAKHTDRVIFNFIGSNQWAVSYGDRAIPTAGGDSILVIKQTEILYSIVVYTKALRKPIKNLDLLTCCSVVNHLFLDWINPNDI